MHVERHQIDESQHVSALAAALDDVRAAPDRVTQHPGYLVTLAERGVDVLCLTTKDPRPTSAAVAVGAQAAAGVFAIAAAVGGSDAITIRLGRSPRLVAVLDLGQDVSAALWLQGFALACITRDMRCLDILRKVEPDDLHTQPGHGWEVEFVRTVQRWIENDPRWRESFAEARGGLLASGEAGDAAVALQVANLDLLPAISDSGFEVALPAALEAHRAFWSGRPADPRGLVAVFPLALCVLLRTRGVTLPVTSPYLPLFWLDGVVPGVTADGGEPERAEALQAASAIVARLRGPERKVQIAELRPQPGDAALVFHGEPGPIEAEYERVFAEVQDLPIDREQTAIDLYIVRSEEFASGGRDAARFPGGYARVADRFVPGFYWFAWRHRRPNATDGLLLDGLVRIGSRWAWFPKPWRVLG